MNPQPPPILHCVTGDIGRWGQRIKLAEPRDRSGY
jgi:hypothetical protein